MRVTLVVALLFIVSCNSSKRDERPQGAVQVLLPQWNGQSYQLQVSEIFSVDNLVELRGWVAQFILWPQAQGDQLVGLAPHINTVRNKEGVYVATDFQSLQMLTVYYHMERLALYDDQVGAAGVNKWPRTIGLQVNSYDEQVGKMENNALYHPEFDALLFLPYDKQGSPMQVNSGILAHEHFHSLFHRLVNRPLSEKFRNISDFNIYYLRGLNEGLADVWGWIYSGDPEFVGRSIPELRLERDVAQRPLSLSISDCQIQGKIAEAYRLGTEHARWLYALSSRVQSEKLKLSRAIIQSLRDFTAEMSAVMMSKKIDFHIFQNLILKNLDIKSIEVMTWTQSLQKNLCLR